MVLSTSVAASFRLRELLEGNGVTQSEFSRVSGLSFATVNRLCNRPPEQIALDTVDKVLGGFAELGHSVGVADLIAWTPPKRGRGK